MFEVELRRSVIESEENDAACDAAECIDKYPGMTYAEGVAAALAWVLGRETERPYSE